MNSIEAEVAGQTVQTPERTILYFRFHHTVGGAIQQVQYDLLETNLSRHRGYDDSAASLCCEGYWAVVATSEDGMKADAIAYTTDYLHSLPDIDVSSITDMLPALNRAE